MIISPAELNQIARVTAPTPDEGRWGIWEKGGDSIPSGGGFKKSKGGLIAVYAGRISFTGDMTPEQKNRMGLSLVEADYILQLEPSAWARAGHMVRQIPDQWAPSKNVVVGSLRQPKYLTAPDVAVSYRATKTGQSGLIEPAWPVVSGQYVDDNRNRWRCEGPVPSYTVMAEIGAGSFSDYLGRVYALQTNQEQR